jgi:hypothetical protein
MTAGGGSQVAHVGVTLLVSHHHWRRRHQLLFHAVYVAATISGIFDVLELLYSQQATELNGRRPTATDVILGILFDCNSLGLEVTILASHVSHPANC